MLSASAQFSGVSLQGPAYAACEQFKQCELSRISYCFDAGTSACDVATIVLDIGYVKLCAGVLAGLQRDELRNPRKSGSGRGFVCDVHYFEAHDV